jgi:hypothetical protein
LGAGCGFDGVQHKQMTASVDIREGLAEAFDVLSEEFQASATVTLLKVSTTTDAFETVLVISTKRFWEYSNFRRNTLLEIADTSSQLTTAMAAATHVSINSDIYIILEADTLPPSGTNPVWQIYLDLFERGSYQSLT